MRRKCACSGGIRENQAWLKLAKKEKISNNELFRSLLEVEQKVGREPGYRGYNAYEKYSVTPFVKRFKNWGNAIAHYRKWKSENPDLVSQKSNEEDSIRPSVEQSLKDNSASITPIQAKPTILSSPSVKKAPEQLYGEPIDFRGLRHAPINEQGVVFLFAMICRELGFNIESIQQGYPDCEGKYLHDKKKNRWAKARIEFEYKASGFQQHGHDPNQCDFIVCWINDWTDCPINVIELKSEILKLRSH